VADGSGGSAGWGVSVGSGRSVGRGWGSWVAGGVAWLGPVPCPAGVTFGGLALCTAFGLTPGKWVTLWKMVPALSLHTEGFALPVAAVALMAITAAPAATSAGARRQALPIRLGAAVLYRALASRGEGGTTLSRAAFRRLSKPGPSNSRSGIGICLLLFTGRQRSWCVK